MKAYDIALFVIICCAASGMINEYMSYDAQLPEYDVGISDAQIEDLTDGSDGSGVSDLSLISMAFNMGNIFFAGIYSALIIAPWLENMGIPSEIALFFNGVLWFVYAGALVQFFSNRNMKAAE